MPAFTTSQWAILVLVLLLGWLLGLLSRSGGAKWRRAYEAERDARVADQGEHLAALAAAQERVAELERARPAAAVRPATPAPAVPRDDLARIRGIGPAGERRLNAAGLHRYAELAALTPAEEAALEERMGADPGYIEQEQWREQAALLADGRLDDHARRFG